MVSRGGRSKGCTNCRRRKVKCDETRPACNHCLKRGIDCSGPKDNTFITWTAEENARRTHKETLITADRPARQLSLLPFQDDICLAYTRKVLLQGGPIEIGCSITSSRGSSADEDPGLKLLRDAFSSLALTFFGSRHQQIAIQTKGSQMYGQVLRQLNIHLGLPGLQTSDSTILTALTCLIHEGFRPTGPNHFLKHLKGIEAILEARGPPPTPIPPTTLALLNGLRLLSIVGGLFLRRPCVYSRDGWNKIPCLHTGEAGRLRYLILCILADCTRFTAERDVSLRTGDRNACNSLLSEVDTALSKLETIHVRWVKFERKQKAANIIKPNTITTHMLYNATYICLLDIRQTLEPLCEYTSLRNAAVLRILDGFQQESYQKRDGASAFQIMRFITGKIAFQVLGGCNSPEYRKLERIIEAAIGSSSVGAREGERADWPQLHHE